MIRVSLPRLMLCMAAVFILALQIGCRGKGVELVRVEGYVTLDGQPPPGPGTLYFTPAEALGGEPLRPGQAQFGSDGFYVARAFSDAVGLIPATYRVGVHCWEVEQTIDGPPAVSFIPMHYTVAGSSNLELTVEPGAWAKTWNVELFSTVQEANTP